MQNNTSAAEARLVFDSLISEISHVKNIDKLVTWLNEKSDFFTAPASTKYHSNFEGGLLVHTIIMTEIALNSFEHFVKCNPETNIKRENVIKACLFHDICKVNNYKMTPKWVKDENNKWLSYPGYEYNDPFPYGHGEKSVYMIEKFIDLTKDEILAIRHHMGNYEGMQYGSVAKMALDKAFEMSPLCSIVHTADVMASFAFEKRLDLKKMAK